MSIYKASLMGAAALLGLNASFAARAQTVPAAASSNTLREVVVSAERRKSSVQKVAASITVRSGDELKNQGKFSLAQILEDVPGVSIPSGALAPAQSDQPGGGVVIRGVPPDAGAPGNATIPTTAYYTDDVSSGIGGDYDIGSVAVLRGPQGTLYGRSATAGVVTVTTNDPVLGKYGASGTVELGSYDLLHATVVLNAPITNSLALRVAGNEYQQNGYVSAKGGRHTLGEGRLKLLYKPSSDVSVLVGLATQEQHVNSGGVNQTLVTPTTIQNSTTGIGEGEDHFRQYWANVNYNLGFANITYIPAYRTWYQNSPSVVVGPGGLELNQVLFTPVDSFLTQELRLASNEDSKLTWLAGAFYYDNKYQNSSGVVVAATGIPVFDSSLNKDTKDAGIFEDASYPIADTWTLTEGLRYDYTKVIDQENYTTGSNPFGFAPFPNMISTTSIGGQAGERTFDNLTFRARIEKQLTPSNTAYAIVSSGFLPGDAQATTISSPTGAKAAVITYAQEKLTAYEIGSKNRFFGNLFQANGDVFYYDYSGFQTDSNTSVGNPGFAILTSPARMYGAELELTYLLTPQDKLGINYGYVNAKFVNEQASFSTYVANTVIPNIPANTLTVNYDHTFALNDGSSLDFAADVRYTSGYSSANILPAYVMGGCGPTGAESCTAYAQVGAQVIGDAHATWASANQKYSVTGYVRNIGDNDYKNSGLLSGYNYATHPPANSFNSTATTYQPRTFGVVLTGKF